MGKDSMKVTFWGTRGSCAVCSPDCLKYGGNTTCVEVESDCLPVNSYLAIDAGTGYIPFSVKVLKNPALRQREVRVYTLLTHLHHDHQQGLLLSPLLFAKDENGKFLVDMYLGGPVEKGKGPEEMLDDMMVPPYFPKSSHQVKSHITFKSVKEQASNVIVFHPIGGIRVMPKDDFERLEAGGHLPVGKNGKYPIEECLIVKMHRSNHPEQTICYRFEERPTGKVFVFKTDHENQPGIPVDVMRYLRGADLLVMDAQYTSAKYETQTCGFGHGTGPYCAMVAFKSDAKKLGLTHHDIFSTDQIVEAIVKEAQDEMSALCGSQSLPATCEIFAAADYLTVQL